MTVNDSSGIASVFEKPQLVSIGEITEEAFWKRFAAGILPYTGCKPILQKEFQDRGQLNAKGLPHYWSAPDKQIILIQKALEKVLNSVFATPS
jgi:hypothetical protein